MSLQITDHARARLQQRGIPLPVLDCLLSFGKKVHDHHGAEILFFDHQARNQIRRSYGEQNFKRLESKLDSDEAKSSFENVPIKSAKTETPLSHRGE